MLRDLFERVIKEYKSARTENFTEHPLKHVLTNEIPEFLKINIDNSNKYKVSGSAGQGKWTYLPWIAIMDKKITESPQKGYYVVYLFREDMKGVYLSINQGMTKVKNQKGNAKTKEILVNTAMEYRKIIGNFSSNFSEYIDLGINKSPKAPFYEAGNVYAKYYEFGDIPSDEKLLSDLNEILSFYDSISNNDRPLEIIEFSEEIQKVQNKFLNVFKEDSNEIIKPTVFGFFGQKEGKTYWNDKFSISLSTEELEDRFWNGIGTIRPSSGSSVSIICEINFPKNGINRRVSGAFAKDDQNNYYVVYRGKLGGGFHQKAFKKYYNGKWIRIKDNKRMTDMVVIGKLDDPNFLLKLKEFVIDVQRIKEFSHSNKLDINKFLSKILRKYKGIRAKDEKVGGHPLAEVFNEFARNLKEFANSNEFSGQSEYYTKSVHFGNNKFVRNPYVYIEYSIIKGFYVGYMFREDMQGVYLALNLGGAGTFNEEYEKNKQNFPNKEDFREFYLDEKRNVIDRTSELSKRFGKSTEGASFSYNTIYAKYYEKNKLPSEEQLQEDLIDIIELYNLLYPSKDDLKVLTNLNEIKQAQELFKNRFLEVTDEIIEANCQSKRLPLNWSSQLGIWGYFGDVENHYFNPFGIGKPNLNSNNQTICEINSPHNGINKGNSGVFAKNYSGKTFLLNRGIFHGNKIRKEDYDGDWVEIEDGTERSDVILIGGLDDYDFPGKLSNFVFDVCKIKKGEDCLYNQNFFEYLSEKGYLFDQKLVENFLLSLKVKQFVILTGNSGTGKTKIAQLFAKYLDIQEKHTPREIYTPILSLTRSVTKYSRQHNGGWRLKPDEIKNVLENINSENLSEHSNNLTLEINIGNKVIRGKCIIKETKQSYSPDQQVYLYYDKDSPLNNVLSNLNGEVNLHLVKKGYKTLKNGRYEIVPVGANWTENRHIVGFYNVITGKYQKTQALDLILRASEGIKDLKDHSSPYFLILDEMNLSHVERYFSDFLSAMESDDPIHLHDNKKLEIPQWKIHVPINIFVIGTVNVDETTYMFSPKVLDRANTLEFLTLPAEDYMSNSPEYNVEGDMDYLLNPLSDIDIRDENINELKSRFINLETCDGKVLWVELSIKLNDLQQILKKADFDFGFRTINEIIRFMYVSWNYDKNLDSPLIWDSWKRYFDAQIMQKMLPKLHGSQKELADILKELEEYCIKENFQESSKKLEKMIKTLKEKRYVSFTG